MPFSLRQPALLLIALCHVMLVVALYLHFGFNLGGEGDKYYTDALALSHGEILKAFDFQWLYSSYIIYLACWVKLGLPPLAMIVITYLLSLWSYYLFYKLLRRYTNALVSKLWLGFMLLSPMMQYWNLSLFSEPFFIAVSLVFLYSWHDEPKRNVTLWMVLMALILLFTRPAGVFVVIVGLAMWMRRHRLWSRQIVFYSAMLVLLILFVGVFFFMPLHFQGYVADISCGAVYAGFPQYHLHLYPETFYTLYDCYRQLIHCAGMVDTSLIVTEKCLSFFNLYRAYYSDWHNAFNLVHGLCYVLAIVALWRGRSSEQPENKAILKACLGIVLLNVLLTGLFFNEWSERYTVSVFPFIFVCAAIGLQALINQRQAKRAV